MSLWPICHACFKEINPSFFNGKKPKKVAYSYIPKGLSNLLTRHNFFFQGNPHGLIQFWLPSTFFKKQKLLRKDLRLF